MRNLLVAAFVALFAFAANAAEYKTTDGKKVVVDDATSKVTVDGADVKDTELKLEGDKTLKVDAEGKEVKEEVK